MFEPLFFDDLRKATGLEFDLQRVEATFRLQSEDQREQYLNDLRLVIGIYNDALNHGGATTPQAQQEWERVNKRIAFWALMLEYATPKRSGLFGRKAISPAARMALMGALSPESEFMRDIEHGL
ncbi:hypothetical protein [Pseudomonas donghuensis]|uniref:hypothetical protein n=1 Tax=Pseudomonas donghuensis TaxID=1163398 RepID=UPI00215F9304|nr:hypothetical protein [Pseudomonas donghuensis]UVL30744.1 hypothetical protein LOY32_06440 [Pseudomonas donghuensis]